MRTWGFRVVSSSAPETLYNVRNSCSYCTGGGAPQPLQELHKAQLQAEADTEAQVGAACCVLTSTGNRGKLQVVVNIKSHCYGPVCFELPMTINTEQRNQDVKRAAQGAAAGRCRNWGAGLRLISHKLGHTYLKQLAGVPRAPPGTHIADSHAVQHMLSTAGASVRHGCASKAGGCGGGNRGSNGRRRPGAGNQSAVESCSLSPAHAKIGTLVTCRQPWRRKLRKQLRAPARSSTTSRLAALCPDTHSEKLQCGTCLALWELHFHPCLRIACRRPWQRKLRKRRPARGRSSTTNPTFCGRRWTRRRPRRGASLRRSGISRRGGTRLRGTHLAASCQRQVPLVVETRINFCTLDRSNADIKARRGCRPCRPVRRRQVAFLPLTTLLGRFLPLNRAPGRLQVVDASFAGLHQGKDVQQIQPGWIWMI